MFAQYLYAKSARRAYISERCSFMYFATTGAPEARDLENRLKTDLSPTLNP